MRSSWQIAEDYIFQLAWERLSVCLDLLVEVWASAEDAAAATRTRKSSGDGWRVKLVDVKKYVKKSSFL